MKAQVPGTRVAGVNRAMAYCTFPNVTIALIA
jgi:hypothetical protein